MKPVLSGWRPTGVVAEGQPLAINGLNVWDLRWAPRGDERVELPHPSYPEQRHRMVVYEIESKGEMIVFAAGELSPGIWGFFEPT
jgi:hypothetical protein